MHQLWNLNITTIWVDVFDAPKKSKIPQVPDFFLASFFWWENLSHIFRLGFLQDFYPKETNKETRLRLAVEQLGR